MVLTVGAGAGAGVGCVATGAGAGLVLAALLEMADGGAALVSMGCNSLIFWRRASRALIWASVSAARLERGEMMAAIAQTISNFVRICIKFYYGKTGF
jgi:hypothetical protein